MIKQYWAFYILHIIVQQYYHYYQYYTLLPSNQMLQNIVIYENFIRLIRGSKRQGPGTVYPGPKYVLLGPF
jgi:hypothetical protein